MGGNLHRKVSGINCSCISAAAPKDTTDTHPPLQVPISVPSVSISISAAVGGFYGMLTQTLIPEGPSPRSKTVAASFVHLPSKLGRRGTKYAQEDLLAGCVPSCLCYVTAALPSPDEN